MGKSVHVVASGETLTKIARDNGTDVATILQQNPHLTSAPEGDHRPRDRYGNHIYPGDRIFVEKFEAGGPRVGSSFFREEESPPEGDADAPGGWDFKVEPYSERVMIPLGCDQDPHTRKCEPVVFIGVRFTWFR